MRNIKIEKFDEVLERHEFPLRLAVMNQLGLRREVIRMCDLHFVHREVINCDDYTIFHCYLWALNLTGNEQKVLNL